MKAMKVAKAAAPPKARAAMKAMKRKTEAKTETKMKAKTKAMKAMQTMKKTTINADSLWYHCDTRYVRSVLVEHPPNTAIKVWKLD